MIDSNAKLRSIQMPFCILCLSFGCTSVFSPSFEGFFFHFLLRSILLIALANRTMPLPTLS
ncbi:hypothetical protein XS11_22715 [Salmonella enterica subsp. enterica serovar Typhimurium]|nr:hypothetical protein [Salmonella enterica subsp. enterica serovar Typhimurium]